MHRLKPELKRFVKMTLAHAGSVSAVVLANFAVVAAYQSIQKEYVFFGIIEIGVVSLVASVFACLAIVALQAWGKR